MHKSQGSEYPAVIIPLTLKSYVMLERNLIILHCHKPAVNI
ncbi:ATP-binding domain-containing protein [Candidatus Rickettsia kedanie]